MRIVPLSLVFALAACAPNSPAAIKQAPGAVSELHMNENYQEVYRTLVEQSRECFETGAMSASTHVRSDLYTDIERGDVSYELIGGFGKDVYATVDILKNENGSTVRIYAAPGFESYITKVERWMRGTGC